MKYWIKNVVLICYSFSFSSLLCQELDFKVYGELFQEKSKLYQAWLEQMGLKPELSVKTIDFTSGEVILYLSFGDRSIDSIEKFWLTKKERLEKTNSIPIEYVLFGKMLKLFEIPASKARIEIYDTYNWSDRKDVSFFQKIWFENNKLVVEGTSFQKRILSPLNLNDSLIFSATSIHYKQWLSNIFNSRFTFDLISSYSNGEVIIDVFIHSGAEIISTFDNIRRFREAFKSNYLFNFEDALFYKASAIFRQDFNKYKISIKVIDSRFKEIRSLISISFTDNLFIFSALSRPLKLDYQNTIELTPLEVINRTNFSTQTKKQMLISKKNVNYKVFNSFCMETGRLGSLNADTTALEHPVTNVSWLEAVVFCNWLSNKSNLKEAYEIKNEIISIDSTADGYRLPFERELELSILSKTINTNNFVFEWCNDVYFESIMDRTDLIRYNPLNYRVYRKQLSGQKLPNGKVIKMGGMLLSEYDDVSFRVVRCHLVR